MRPLVAERVGPPGGRTIFQIGSITKVVTSLLLADAVERGTGGFFSFVALDPAAGAGVVVLTDTARSVDRLGMAVLDRLTGSRAAVGATAYTGQRLRWLRGTGGET